MDFFYLKDNESWIRLSRIEYISKHALFLQGSENPIRLTDDEFAHLAAILDLPGAK
jgi:galactose-1-phosphate uridylyltransferase